MGKAKTKSKPKPVVDPVMQALEQSVLKVLEHAQGGLNNDGIMAALKMDVKREILLKAYNHLLGRGRLKLTKRFDGKDRPPIIIYTFVSAEDAKKLRGLDSSDRLIYDLITKAGEEGITKRELKGRSNISSAPEIKQILDRLMSRALVKEVKSIQSARKIVYVLAELEASVAHTGGPWFNDEKEFDTEFIETMYAQVRKYIKRHGSVTLEQVTNVVAELKISNEPLTQENIKELMSTMVYDGSVETYIDPSDENIELYRCVRATPAVNHLASSPCGACPLMHECAPGAVISPKTCTYMTEWLKGAELW